MYGKVTKMSATLLARKQLEELIQEDNDFMEFVQKKTEAKVLTNCGGIFIKSSSIMQSSILYAATYGKH